VHKWFWWGDLREGDHLQDLREGDHLQDPGVDGRIKLKWIFKKEVGCGGNDWIDLAQDRDRCWELVNTVMNLLVP